MKYAEPYYEANAYPDGRCEVSYVHLGGEQATTLCSRTVRAGQIPVGMSPLEGAEALARDVIAAHKAKAAERRRLCKGRVSFTVKG